MVGKDTDEALALNDKESIAAVAGDDPEVCRRALAAIEVDYDVLPHVTDVDEAPTTIGELAAAALEELGTEP